MAGAAIEPLLECHRPFPLEPGEFAREKIQDGILAVQLHSALGVRGAEAGALQAGEGGAFRGGIAGGVTGWRCRVGKPQALVVGGDAAGHDARSVRTLEQGRELRQAALEFEQKLRRRGLQGEIFRAKIGGDMRGFGELRPELGEKQGDLCPGNAHGRLQHAAQGRREPERLQARFVPDPVTGQKSGRAEIAAKGHEDFAVLLERDIQGRQEWFCRDLDRGAASQGDARLSREQRQEFEEVACIQDEGCGWFAGEFLEAGEEYSVGVAEGERLILRKGVQRGAAVTSSGLEHEHHFAASGGLDKIGREQDEQFGGFTIRFETKRGS